MDVGCSPLQHYSYQSSPSAGGHSPALLHLHLTPSQALSQSSLRTPTDRVYLLLLQSNLQSLQLLAHSDYFSADLFVWLSDRSERCGQPCRSCSKLWCLVCSPLLLTVVVAVHCRPSCSSFLLSPHSPFQLHSLHHLLLHFAVRCAHVCS